MKTIKYVPAFIAAGLVLSAFSGVALAQDLGGLKGIMGGGSSLTSGSTGNAAGIIEYCIKNNYLGGNDASSVQDKLMGKLGGEDKAKEDPGYTSGLSGMLTGSDGKNTNLADSGSSGGGMSGMGGMGGMKDKLTKKACAIVLKQGKSML